MENKREKKVNVINVIRYENHNLRKQKYHDKRAFRENGGWRRRQLIIDRITVFTATPSSPSLLTAANLPLKCLMQFQMIVAVSVRARAIIPTGNNRGRRR